jgi:monothiol glutaredoxin
MSLSPETRAIIQDLLRDNRVVLFMKGTRTQPQCGFSAKTVAALDLVLPDYVAVDVLKYPEIREGIKAYGNWPTVPQLYVDGELIGGSDIVTELFEGGELGATLGVAEPADGEPVIQIDPAARTIMRNALEGHPGHTIHLKIDAGFDHSLTLGPPRPGSRAIECGDITLQADRWSAARADGLRIAVRESLQGQGFSFHNPNAPPPVRQLSVQELKSALDRGDTLHLYDVRGEDERALAAIAAGKPWDEAAMRAIDALPRDASLVFYCHKGGRSQGVAEGYRRRGYTNVANLAGGIEAWSRDIDPQVPTY